MMFQGEKAMLEIFQDISEKKEAEIELIAAKEKAEESDRLKSAFLANMSHEIRTPLNSIIGFSDLLVDPFYDIDQYAEFANLIRMNGRNLLSIINDIMDLSKIEAGHVQVNKRLFSVNQLILDIHENCLFKAMEKGIELRIGRYPQMEIFIESDETKLRQVLVNCVGNAIKFTEEGFVEIGIKTEEEFIQFHVKDTGIGIPVEFHEQIFERFRQVETGDTRKYGGNGLGLPISKSLVELLGGTIWMESEYGKGSTFYFNIPRQ
jgi:signal transduction histidine kinase